MGIFNVGFCQIVLQKILLIYTAAYEYIFPPSISLTLAKNINFARFISENLHTEFLIDADLRYSA